MALKELSFGTGSKFDLKNHILESCSSSLRRDLRSSFPLKSSFGGTCNLKTSERISNVILQTSNISLENKTITSSNLKRKYSFKDGLSSKRTVLSQVHSSLDEGGDLLPSATYFHQKEYIRPPSTLSSEADLEMESLSAGGNNSSEPLLAAHQMPHYEFSPLKFDDVQQDELYTAKDKLVDYMSEKKKEEQLLKDQFLTLVSTSLMCSPNFRDLSSEFCQLLLSKAEEVASHYPEFILKVALYTRQELNIRTTANFLLAYAAHNVNSRCYLKQYFTASICLPSDWMEVAEICKKLSEQNGTSFPSALRRAMVEAFSKFDDYQLAKYNRDPTKQMKRKQRKRLKQKAKKVGYPSYDQENIVTPRQIYTLKRLIQVLHITKPVEHVMCILQKKYPIDLESFHKSKLPGSWDEEKAGKRMKLPVPETWETAVSAHGNKAAVWENLIDKKKLPYMATLRNIRNLVIAGISRKHHNQVLKKLCDEKTVMKSRQFPLRFFAAYEAIHELKMICSKNDTSAGRVTYMIPRRRIPGKLSIWEQKLQRRLEKRAKNVNAALLKEYKLAVDKAVEISCRNNVDPIQGKTLVICDVLSCRKSVCQTLKGSIVSKMHQACLLLGMMISCVAEECELKLVKCSGTWETLHMEDDSILNNVLKASHSIKEQSMNEEDIQTNVQAFYNEDLPALLNYYLCAAVEHVQLDQVVLLTSGTYFDSTNGDSIMKDFAKKYRMKSNKHLLYLKVDLTGNKNSIFRATDPNDVMVCGFSDQLLRFMSERGGCRQLEYVENIDKKYELKPIPKPRPSLDDPEKKELLQLNIASSEMQRWKTVRVFISSTFKDMHGERDLIVRYIMPELRARAKTLCVNIHEVDLRWGVTEAESSNNKAMEICLAEASRCEFFLGILGERYGNVYDYNVPDDLEFEWLKGYPPGASVTELEMYCAALSNPAAAANNSFFYFRDKSFIEKIPEVWMDDFVEKSEYNMEKLRVLKEKIKCSGLEVFENYPCSWGGVVNGLPLVAGLEEFGERILQNLWNALCKKFKKDESPLTDQKISALHTDYSEAFQTIVKQENFIESCITTISKNDGMFVITGKSGCGKTALMRQLSKEDRLQPIFPYFFGIDSRSCYLHNMLNDLILSLISFFRLEIIPPVDYQNMVNLLPDILETAIDSSTTSTISIFIDGLDHVMPESENILDWLPGSLPKGLKMVVSASQESVIYKSLSKKLTNVKPMFELAVKPLTLSERQEFVTKHLEPHHKVLDKSPFNNQLSMLTSKRDAGYPLYLHLACEELRTFGIFEELTPRLRSYPQTFLLLLKEVISQLENFHGKNLLKIALCFLAVSPEGLSEDELHALLSVASEMKKFDEPFESVVGHVRNLKPENILPPMKFSSLLRTLHGLLEISGTSISDTLRITHNEILKFVCESYMNKGDVKMARRLHGLVAAYFYNEIMPQMFETKEEASVRLFRLLPYHLNESQQYSVLCNILCNISYIKSALERGLKSELLDHYLVLKELFLKNTKLMAVTDNSKKIVDYYNFVSYNLNILSSYPCLIHQQALNEPHHSFVYKDCDSCPKDGLIRWLTKPHTRPMCYLTLSGFQQAVVTTAASSDGKIAALGMETGLIQIIDPSTGKLLRTFRGHSQVICSLCFLGNNQLCSASADCTLCVWDIENGHRIHILKGHTRRVSACCFSPCGRHIISVAWDCTLRVWNAKDGQELRTTKVSKYPLTCLSHHPHKALVVAGGWDRKLQIWDLIKMTKKQTLKGHSSSVRSVAFSPCGQTVISASFSGEIFYWSVTLGIQIGKIKDSGHPINCLNFTKSGDMLISGSDENLLKIWSYKRGEVVQEVTLNEHGIHCVTFLSLEYIAVGYKSGLCIVFEICTGHEYWRNHHIKDAITCLEPFCEESSKCLLGCIIGSLSGNVMLVRFQENKRVFATIHQEVTAATVLEGNIIAGTTNGEIFVIPFVSLNPIPISAHQGAITKCIVKQNQLITVSNDRSLKVWHLAKEADLILCYSLPHCHGDWVTACTYADDMLITGSQDCSIKLWGTETGENRASLSELKSPINHLAVQGKYIIAGTVDGCVGIWNQEGAFLTSLPPLENCGSVDVAHITETVLSKNQNEVYHHLVASVQGNDHLIIRKPFSKTLLTTLTCQSSPVSSFCVTAEDKIISCSFSDKVQFWKIENIEKHSKPAHIQHKATITRVEFSPSGKYALSTDARGKLIVWAVNLSSENSLHYITGKEWQSGSIPDATFVQSGRDLEIIGAINDSAECSVVSLKLTHGTVTDLKEVHSHHFRDEVLSVDYNHEIVTFAMKSGVIFITDRCLKVQKKVHVSDNWVIRTFSPGGSNKIYAIAPHGIFKHESYSSKNRESEKWKDFSDIIPWPRASYMTGDKCYIGTGDGFLYIISEEITTKQKIHSSAVNGISICCNFIFTCSEDNTIKVWEVTSLKQVSLFFFPLPITVLSAHHSTKGSDLITIICGTAIGETHLLTWHSQSLHSS